MSTRRSIRLVILVGIVGLVLAPETRAWADHECFAESGLHGGSGDNNFPGTSDKDVWSDLEGDDGADGKAGGDKLCGDDDLDGTASAPADFLGGGGADKLDGGGGRDILKGEDGNDDIYGRLGDDVVYGGGGDDLLDPGNDSDNDNVWCGGGTDTVVVYGGDTINNPSECEVFV